MSIKISRTPIGKERSEAGDTLVEVLIAMVVLGIAAVAMLLAFGTSISGSSEHTSLTTFDTVLRTASEEATALTQGVDASSVFSNCNAATLITPASFSIPSAYSAKLTGVQYWSNATSSFPGSANLSNACTPSVPQLLTITVTSINKGSTSTIQTVVNDPLAPPAAGVGSVPAQLAFVQQPGGGTTGSALYPQPEVAIEDSSGNVVSSDFSTISLSLNTVTGAGGTMSNCSASHFDGQADFSNCSVLGVGTYTLTATDTVDSLSSTSAIFSVIAGAPTQLVFTTQPGSAAAGAVLTPQPVVTIEDSYGNTVLSDNTTVTLAIGTNPSSGTLSATCIGTTSAGVATFTGCSINLAGTGYTLTATDTKDGLTTPSTPSHAFNVTSTTPVLETH
jgi:type II secretory pathway pseudopilin PulG